MGTDRIELPEGVQAEVLTRSRRRCCMCFGLDRDLGIKQGQIAHVDRNTNNNTVDNLTFLCLPHHDQYDSVTSQSKSFRSSEIRVYRDELYQYFSTLSDLYSKVTSKSDLQKDLKREVLLEISLIPHEWKIQYIDMYPGHFAEGTFERRKEYSDVWEMMDDVGTREYSRNEWKIYL